MAAGYSRGKAGTVAWSVLGTTATARIVLWELDRSVSLVNVDVLGGEDIDQLAAGKQIIRGTLTVRIHHSDSPPAEGAKNVLTLQTDAVAPYWKHIGTAILERLSHRREDNATDTDRIAYAFVGCDAVWPDPELVAG